jgi:Ca2+-binding EF-hand superfamily protein
MAIEGIEGIQGIENLENIDAAMELLNAYGINNVAESDGTNANSNDFEFSDEMIEKIIELADKDENGKLCISELGIPQEAFDYMDKNEDGLINSKEMKENLLNSTNISGLQSLLGGKLPTPNQIQGVMNGQNQDSSET